VAAVFPILGSDFERQTEGSAGTGRNFKLTNQIKIMIPQSSVPTVPPRRPKDMPLTPDEEFKNVLAEIGQELERLEGSVSELRVHSVGTHLKGVLRLLGFYPRKEWADKDWIGLHKMTVAAHKSLGEEIPEGREDDVLRVAKCVLSNLKAETREMQAPEALKEAPAAG